MTHTLRFDGNRAVSVQARSALDALPAEGCMSFWLKATRPPSEWWDQGADDSETLVEVSGAAGGRMRVENIFSNFTISTDSVRWETGVRVSEDSGWTFVTLSWHPSAKPSDPDGFDLALTVADELRILTGQTWSQNGVRGLPEGPIALTLGALVSETFMRSWHAVSDLAIWEHSGRISNAPLTGREPGLLFWLNDVSSAVHDHRASKTNDTGEDVGWPSSTLMLNGVDDYAVIDRVPAFPDTEVTLSLWLKAESDGPIHGTPFSYAVPERDNELTLYNVSNLLVYVANKRVDTGLNLKDGAWHFVVATWRSSDGRIEVWVDGVSRFTGTVATGLTLRDHGCLIVGQEQDTVGGGFHAIDAFAGAVRDVTIWHGFKSLTQPRIVRGDEDGLVLRVDEDTARAVKTTWRPSGLFDLKCNRRQLLKYRGEVWFEGGVMMSFWLRTDERSRPTCPLSIARFSHRENTATLTIADCRSLSLCNSEEDAVGPSGPDIADGRWHHLALTLINDVARLYCDGIAIGPEVEWPESSRYYPGLCLGGHWRLTGSHPSDFRGEIRQWMRHRVRDEAETRRTIELLSGARRRRLNEPPPEEPEWRLSERGYVRNDRWHWRDTGTRDLTPSPPARWWLPTDPHDDSSDATTREEVFDLADSEFKTITTWLKAEDDRVVGPRQNRAIFRLDEVGGTTELVAVAHVGRRDWEIESYLYAHDVAGRSLKTRPRLSKRDWHFCAWSCDAVAGEVREWVNGVEVKRWRGDVGTASRLTFGFDSHSMRGYVDEFTVWDRLLDESELARLMESGPEPDARGVLFRLNNDSPSSGVAGKCDYGGPAVVRPDLSQAITSHRYAPPSMAAPRVDWVVDTSTFSGRAEGGNRFVGRIGLANGQAAFDIPGAIISVQPDGNWSVEFDVGPDHQALVESLASDVTSRLPTDDAWDWLHGSTIIIANADGAHATDDPSRTDLGTYIGGVNIYRKVDLSTVSDFLAPVSAVMGLIGLGHLPAIAGEGIVGLGLGIDAKWMAAFTQPVHYELPVAGGVLETLSVCVVAEADEQNITLGVEFSFEIDGALRPFYGGVTFESDKEPTLLAWSKDDWKNPFGVRGIALTDFGLECGWPSLVPKGGFGGFEIPSIGIAGHCALKLDESDPMASIVALEYDGVVGTFDICMALLDLDAPPVPTMVEFHGVDVYIAPGGGTIAGKIYGAGVTLAGRVEILGFISGAAEGLFDRLEGGYLTCVADDARLQVGGFEMVRLDGATVHVELRPGTGISGSISGGLSLLDGLFEASVTLPLDGGPVALPTPTSPFMADLQVSMVDGGMRITFVPEIETNIAGIRVQATVDITMDFQANSLVQTARFTYRVPSLNLSGTTSTVNVSIPMTSPEAVALALAAELEDLLTELLKNPGTLVRWFENNISKSFSKAFGTLSKIIDDPAELLDVLEEGFDLDLGSAAGVLKSAGHTTAAIAKLIDPRLGEAADGCIDFAERYGNNVFATVNGVTKLVPTHLAEDFVKWTLKADVLKKAGAHIAEVGRVLGHNDMTVEAMEWVGWSATEVTGVAKYVWRMSGNEIVKALRNVFPAKEVAAVTEKTLRFGQRAAAKAFKYAGYGVSTVGDMLGDMGLGDKAIAETLQYAGYAVEQVGTYLTDVLGLGQDAAEELLGAVGYTAGEIAKFAEDVAHALNPSNW